ncbi:unnamed protein product [Larinioides sclopetarius]|uniref:Uncharacterized protein n=1 Tax=Larinioides sclopetarius TaxID=280406 RepID=A0AAV2B4R2_9ARAC
MSTISFRNKGREALRFELDFDSLTRITCKYSNISRGNRVTYVKEASAVRSTILDEVSCQCVEFRVNRELVVSHKVSAAIVMETCSIRIFNVWMKKRIGVLCFFKVT